MSGSGRTSPSIPRTSPATCAVVTYDVPTGSYASRQSCDNAITRNQITTPEYRIGMIRNDPRVHRRFRYSCSTSAASRTRLSHSAQPPVKVPERGPIEVQTDSSPADEDQRNIQRDLLFGDHHCRVSVSTRPFLRRRGQRVSAVMRTGLPGRKSSAAGRRRCGLQASLPIAHHQSRA
jgi:hypothetical protein